MTAYGKGFHFEGKALGVGDEKVVYEDPNNPELVVSLHKEDTGDRELSPSEMNARFYLTKIIHLLFPQSIPDIAMSASEPNLIKRKKIQFDSDHDAIRRLRLLREEGEEPSEELIQASKRVGEKIKSDGNVLQLAKALENLGVDVDRASQNFGYDVEGNVIYIEEFNALRMAADGPQPWFDIDKIERAIEGLDDKKREQASTYLERLKKLIAEEIARIRPSK